MTPLIFNIPGKFDKGKNYRRRVKDIAWEAVETLPKKEWSDWPTTAISVTIKATNTLPTRREGRSLLNMMRGVIFRDYAAIEKQLYVFDERLDTHIRMVIRRVTHEST